MSLPPTPSPEPATGLRRPASWPVRAERLVGGLLTGAPWSVDGPPRRRLALLLGIIGAGGAAYGLVMGTHGGVTPDRWPQMTFSALKVPLLLLATFALGLPSFFVLHSLLGLRDDFGRAVRALLATQSGLTLVLAALAPLTAWFYAGGPGYRLALLWNAAAFGVASLSAQLLLRRHYRQLIARHPQHRLLLRGWLVLYGFTGVQMGWVLRPFIGSPDRATTFFRTDAWGNAYQEVWRTLLGVLGAG